MMKYTIALVVLWWAAASAYAGETPVLPVQVKSQAAVKECGPDGTCRIAYKSAVNQGSAVAIGYDKSGRLLALTAGHILEGRTSNVAWVGVDRRWTKATVLAGGVDADTDLALLAVEYTGKHNVYPLAGAAAINSPASIIGYAGDPRQATQTYRARRGVLRSVTDRWLYWRNAQPIEGESGGAVVVDGHLAGVITHAVDDGSGEGRGMSAVCLRRFVQNCLGYVPGDSVEVIVDAGQPAPQPPVVTEPPVVVEPPVVDPPISQPPPDASELYRLRTENARLKEQLAILDARDIQINLRDPDSQTWNISIKPKLQNNEVSIVAPNATAAKKAFTSPGVPVNLDLTRDKK